MQAKVFIFTGIQVNLVLLLIPEFLTLNSHYEKRHDRKADRAMVISPMIDPRARDLGHDLGIELFGFAEDVTVQ